MTIQLRPFDSIGDVSSLDASASASLIEAARNGCDDALNELIQSLRGYLLLIANQELDPIIGAKVAPSDLVQSVLFRAQQNLADFRGTSRQTLLAWLRRMLLNEINAKRRYFHAGMRDVHREVGSADGVLGLSLPDTHSPQRRMVQIEESHQLRAAIEALSVEYRTVVYLRNWQQLSFREIGERMSRSEDAAKKLWQRAICRLQRELGDEP